LEPIFQQRICNHRFALRERLSGRCGTFSRDATKWHNNGAIKNIAGLAFATSRSTDSAKHAEMPMHQGVRGSVETRRIRLPMISNGYAVLIGGFSERFDDVF
jgi:hypothetical protein